MIGAPLSILVALAAIVAVSLCDIESNFYYSESCVKAHGSCVLEKECPHPVDDNYKTLCPDQKGAICCKDFPVQQLNCHQLHNDCRKTCPKQLDLGKKGCQNGNTCCVLL